MLFDQRMFQRGTLNEDFKLGIPSLEQLCLVKSACYLFNKKLKLCDSKPPDYVHLIKLTQEFELSPKLQLNILNDIDQSKLPDKIKAKVFHMVLNSYFDSWEWNIYCRGVKTKCKVPRMSNFAEIHLTSAGRLDESKMLDEYIFKMSTTMYLTTDEVFFWYRISCDWCLADNVHRLWTMMSEKEHRNIISKCKDNMLMAYWLNQCGDTTLNIPENDHYDPRKKLFLNLVEYSLMFKKKHAVTYMLYRLLDYEKDYIVPKCIAFATRYRLPDLLLWCFQRLTVFCCEQFQRRFAWEVLDCFIQYPYEKYFFICLDNAIACLRFKEFACIIREILRKVRIYQGLDDVYEKILEQFWTKCSPHLKTYIRKKASFQEDFKEFIEPLEIPLEV